MSHEISASGSLIDLKKQSARLDLMIANQEVEQKSVTYATKVVKTATAKIKLDQAKVEHKIAETKLQGTQNRLDYHQQSVNLSQQWFELNLEGRALNNAFLAGNNEVKRSEILEIGFSLDIPALNSSSQSSLPE